MSKQKCYKCGEEKELKKGRIAVCNDCEPHKRTPTYYEELLAKQEGMTIEEARKWLRKYRNPFSLN